MDQEKAALGAQMDTRYCIHNTNNHNLNRRHTLLPSTKNLAMQGYCFDQYDDVLRNNFSKMGGLLGPKYGYYYLRVVQCAVGL